MSKKTKFSLKLKRKNKISKSKGEILDLLNIAEELNSSISKMTFIDNKKMFLEGKTSIIDCYEEYIKFSTHHMYVIIVGKDLSITDINENELIIFGKIESVQYINR